MPYYVFWIRSSRGTDDRTVRFYKEKPTKEQLKDDVETWGSSFAAWVVSENHVSYGFEQLRGLPRNRKACLASFHLACKNYQRWSDRRKILSALLGLPGYNGAPKLPRCAKQ